MSKIRKSSNSLDPTRMMLSELGRVFCIIAIVIPVLILFLREFNYSFLLSVTPDGSIVQDPLGSVCFIITGIVLYILRNEIKYTKLIKIISYIPLVISFIGLTELYVFSVEIFFKSDVPLIYVATKEGIEIAFGRLAPNSSLCFILLGISIFYIDTKSDKKKRVMQFLNYAIVLIALLSIYGYIYKVEPLYYTGRTVLMSFHSSICFFLISSAVLFLRPERGSMHVLIGENPTEVILLRFIALILPLLFGWIKLKGERAGWYDSEFGTTLYAIINFIIIMFFLGRKSTVQYRLRRARAKIQEIIKRDNEKLTTILDSSPTSVSIYDLESDKIVYINKMEELKLSNAKAILNIPVQDFVRGYIYKDDIPKVLDRINEYKSFKDKIYYPMEYRYHDPNGNIHWLHVRATVYKRVNGEVKQILTNSIEVTEQRKAAEELEESRKFIEKITNTSASIIYIYDLVKHINIYVNKNIETILGYSEDEIKAFHDQLFKVIMHPEDIPRISKYHESFMHAKPQEIKEIEYRIKNKEGSYRWYYSRDTVFSRDETGNPTQIIGVSHDITGKKRNELMLRKQEKELRMTNKKLSLAQKDLRNINLALEERVKELVESRKFIQKVTKASANIIYIFDLEEYKSIYANRFIETLLGYTMEEVEALGSELVYSLMHPDDIDKLGKYYEEFKYAKDDEVREIEYRMKHKLGNWIWLYSRDTVFRRADNGMVDQIVGIAHDVTTRKENELQLMQKNQELGDAYSELYKAQYELKGMNSELEERVKDRTKQLNESQEKYRTFILQSSEGIWRYEFKEIYHIDTNLPTDEQVRLILKHGFIAECNDRMAIHHGFESAKELIGMPINKFLLITDDELNELVLNFIKAGYSLTNLETKESTQHEETRYFRNNILGIVEDGKLLRCWGTEQDITDQKRAADALKESEKRYHHMVDRIPEIFWCADAEGKVQYYNEKWHDYTRETDGHKLKEWLLYVHTNDVSRVLNLWKDCIKYDRECYTEYRLRRFDGMYRWHLIRATPIKNKNGEVINWMSTSTDIHDQKVKSDELRNKNRDLVKITNDVSKDLENTISNIETLISDSNIVKSDKYKSSEEDTLKKTKKSVDKLKKIISESDDLRK